jgi:GxxExxY protein
MSTNEEGIVYKDISFRIIGFAIQVHNELGYGFLEKVYENALMVLLKSERIPAKQQAAISVYFLGEVVGEYYADILVDNKIILEIKSVEKIIQAHRAQALNYLKATGLKLAIILNFGKEKLEFQRLVK